MFGFDADNMLTQPFVQQANRRTGDEEGGTPLKRNITVGMAEVLNTSNCDAVRCFKHTRR